MSTSTRPLHERLAMSRRAVESQRSLDFGFPVVTLLNSFQVDLSCRALAVHAVKGTVDQDFTIASSVLKLDAAKTDYMVLPLFAGLLARVALASKMEEVDGTTSSDVDDLAAMSRAGFEESQPVAHHAKQTWTEQQSAARAGSENTSVGRNRNIRGSIQISLRENSDGRGAAWGPERGCIRGDIIWIIRRDRLRRRRLQGHFRKS
jgi:hypothetical protein